MILSLIVGFVLGAAALVFALQNTALVALTFLGWQFQSSLALLVLISVTVGAVIALLVSIPAAIRDSFKMMALRKENKNLVSEIEAFRQSARTVIVEEPVAPVLDIRNS